jgi:basic membrane lipoprotein Med (substrate-binding protein (PBP1-ABC) superfamily)
MQHVTRVLTRYVAVFNTAIFMLACQGSDHAAAKTDSAAAKPAGRVLRVALITPGPVSDQGWNGSAYDGLLRIKDSLGASVSHIETATPAEFEENFRAYGAQGYDLVFGHGSEFQDAAIRVGPEFPKTVFVTTGGNRAVGNVVGIEFAFEEGSYIAGMIAGAITKSNVVGCIGGTELPPVKRSFDAFADGARAVNAHIRVLTSYIGNWDDASAGKEQGLAQIGRGADVIFGNADAAGLGVFQAARESHGVRMIGANADQTHVAPELVIGSVVIDVPHAFLSVARELQAGTFTSRVISFGTKSDVVRWVDNPALAATVPAARRTQIDSVIARFKAGTFVLRPPGAAPAR